MRARLLYLLYPLMAGLLIGCVEQPSRPAHLSATPPSTKAPPPAPPLTQPQLVGQYREAVNLTAKGSRQAIAMRRLADLELSLAESMIQSSVPEDVAAGHDYLQAAIKRYSNYLLRYPQLSTNDQTLYQQARAYSLAGEMQLALETMTRVVTSYPDTPYYAELQFRRAETYFVFQQYSESAAAYHDIVTNHRHSIYYEKALYKLGWAQFKQQQYDRALDSYLTLLDLKMAQGMLLKHQLSESISRADRELLGDTLRVTSLAFSYQQGATTIGDYFDRHGARNYEALLYRQLGELYLNKGRVTDAADTYLSYVTRHPQSHLAPLLHDDAINAYQQGKFPLLVLQTKTALANRYGVNTPYWMAQSPHTRLQITPLLTRHINDLAQHYHASARKGRKESDYRLSEQWYRTYIRSFPEDGSTPRINFLLAELLHDAGRYPDALQEYENSAYNYPLHSASAESGYAAIVTYDLLIKQATGDLKTEIIDKKIASSLRFSDRFPGDQRVPSVLTKAAEHLYQQKNYQLASDTAERVLKHGTDIEKLSKTIWTLYGHSQFELGYYSNAERAYNNVLRQIPSDQLLHRELSERLAATIYKRAEQLAKRGEHTEAAEQYMRIGDVTPSSPLRMTAQYDAATTYIKVKEWRRAIELLEDFRQRFPKEEKLQLGVTEKLALAYSSIGQGRLSAQEMLRLGERSPDREYRRNMMLQAAETYDRNGDKAHAAVLYAEYIEKYPHPIANVIEAQQYLADYYKAIHQPEKRVLWLKRIIDSDQRGGSERTTRTRFLAASATLELADMTKNSYQTIKLTAPLKASLQKKKGLMKKTIALYEKAVKYNFADVTTAATYQLAEVYNDFAGSLMTSDRPEQLSEEEREQYDILLEEQAYPFEEKAIEIHEVNLKRTTDGIYDSWVNKSREELAEFQPARYAKKERTISYVEISD